MVELKNTLKKTLNFDKLFKIDLIISRQLTRLNLNPLLSSGFLEEVKKLGSFRIVAHFAHLHSEVCELFLLASGKEY